MTPCFSIVIAVWNDWDRLKDCLRGLCWQKGAPDFEVVVVDDGSSQSCPEGIDRELLFPVTVLRQRHGGVSAARNAGITAARGDVIVIVDCDSMLDENCLRELSRAVSEYREDSCFQLNVGGERTTLVGRIESLHWATIQEDRLRADGHIGYLNTTGAAIRRKAEGPTVVFDPRAVRGEDTQLLAELMMRGELPRFVPEASVCHAVRLPLYAYLLKAIRNGHSSAQTYGRIRGSGIEVRLRMGERIRALSTAWKNMRRERLGTAAFGLLIVRQMLSLVTVFACSVGSRVRSATMRAHWLPRSSQHRA